mmetsp:Transcript_53371/g.114709  ORF Transcript_53371/g.114709 Transcript_53371/m.114709 type:complete len:235 (+) Transcript_53371:94-798(+)
MVKGGRKPNHSRGGSKYGSMEDDVLERNAAEAADSKVAAADEDDDEGQGEASKPKNKSMMERDADLEAELEAQFGNEGGLTRKQREELEKQEKERKEQKELKEGKSDEAKADMERLAEIRRKREEAAAAKKLEQERAEAEASAKEKAASQEEAGNKGDKEHPVASQVAKLVEEAKDKKLSLNFLNQDAACKKVLKPLCKKENVKAINKAWLEKFATMLVVTDEGKGEITLSLKK